MSMETDIGKYGSGFYGSDLDGRRMVIDMSKKSLHSYIFQRYLLRVGCILDISL